MKLKLKEEYKEWSVAVKTYKKIKLKNLDPVLYEEVYKEHPEFFATEKSKVVVVEEVKEETKTTEEKKD